MRISFEVEGEAVRRLATEAQLERRSANNTAYFLLLQILEEREQQRASVSLPKAAEPVA